MRLRRACVQSREEGGAGCCLQFTRVQLQAGDPPALSANRLVFSALKLHFERQVCNTLTGDGQNSAPIQHRARQANGMV